jgi:hypothetical protein
MTTEKLEWKKAFKDLYQPSAKPTLIDVPEMRFIMVEGKGDPNHAEYQQAVELLYTLSYTIKFKGKHFPGYVDCLRGILYPESNTLPKTKTPIQNNGVFDYSVPPLEGLWWEEDGSFNLAARDKWNWISMIRQYDFVTQEVFAWAIETAKQKNPELDFSKARLETFTEGLCVQAMHIGPYAEEPATVAKMHAFINDNNLKSAIGKDRKHHELYVMNPLKTAPEKLKTVLRIPVKA